MLWPHNLMRFLNKGQGNLFCAFDRQLGIPNAKPPTIHLESNISKTTWARDFKFGAQFCMVNAELAHK